MPRHLLLLFLLLPALAFAQNLSSSADLSGLFSLRASLGLRARDWPRKADPCSQWVGVGCRNGRVISIDLHGLKRTRLGRLHPQFDVDGLQHLKLLETFNASGFALPGPIPVWFGTLLPPSFSALDLSGSSVNGSIPESVGGVSGLRFLSLSGNSISGAIPLSLGQLSNLTYLDLSSNSLTGTIPPALGGLSNLTYLDFSSNQLQGPIPPSLGSLTNLRTLDLHRNAIGGSIPLELGNLSRLVALDISTNSFSGALPDSLWALQSLQSIDFSHNNLTGSLPDNVAANAGSNPNGTAVSFNLSYNLYYGDIPEGFANLLDRFSSVDLSKNYFQGLEPTSMAVKELNLEDNCFRNATNQRSIADCQSFYASKRLPYDGPVSPAPASTPPSSSPSRKKSGWSVKYILIGVFSGIVFLLIVITVIIFCIRRCRGQAAEQREVSRNSMPIGAAPQNPSVSVSLSVVGDSFTYDQLVLATSGFSETNLIKHGHSGDLYRGKLENGAPVVVKRIDLLTFKKESYTVELDVFSRASHTRLVPFLGHCLENENEKFLVYKFMPNMDLSNSLFMKKGPEEEGLKSLDWIKRLKIATGMAEALCFFHHECNPPLVHRDIQASSILLDDKFEVRLGSLSEVCPQEGDGHQSVITRILRLSQAAESSSSGSSSQTCAYDVYCLGKVLLELITGKLGISGSIDSASIEWLDHSLQFISIYDKELVTKIMDSSLIVDEDHLEEVWAMAVVAKSCLNPKPSKRPPTRYILKALENPLKVVREETSSGSGPLRTTSSRGSWNFAFFGSWRHGSADMGGQQKEDRSGGLKRSGTLRSQGSTEEQQHPSHQKKPSKDIYPEPSATGETNDGHG